jgi:benzaldehyde dehydrogenase (NAD)
MTTDTWLTPTEVWSGKIYSNGWKKPGLGTADVTEKATGAALVKEPLVDMISFTGSTRVGRQVASIASGQLKRVSLELGGNNPYIVLDDADIEVAASAGAWGAFFHQGQICVTAGRHLVHERIADAYAKALVRKVKALVVAETIAKGAKVLTGGSRKGLFFEPTVITGVTPGMAAFDEERFGPVAVITTFRNDEEAIALANTGMFQVKSAGIDCVFFFNLNQEIRTNHRFYR